jgi:hypothetical protein
VRSSRKSLTAMPSLTLAAAAAYASSFFSGPTPVEWVPVARSPASAIVPLVVGLAPVTSKRAELEESFFAVSDPRNPRYGKHLSREEVLGLLHPGVEAAAAVRAEICSLEGVTCTSEDDESLLGVHHLLYADATVAAMERLTGLEYFTHEISALAGGPLGPGPVLHRIPVDNVTAGGHPNLVRPATLSPAVAELVDMIHPTTHLPHPRNILRALHGVRELTGDEQANGVTPAVIRAQYGIGTVEAVNATNKQQVTGFLGEYVSPADLDSFYKQFYPKAEGKSGGGEGGGGRRPGHERALTNTHTSSRSTHRAASLTHRFTHRARSTHRAASQIEPLHTSRRLHTSSPLHTSSRFTHRFTHTHPLPFLPSDRPQAEFRW